MATRATCLVKPITRPLRKGRAAGLRRFRSIMKGRAYAAVVLVLITLILLHLVIGQRGTDIQATMVKILHELAAKVKGTPVFISAPCLVVFLASSCVLCMPYTIWSVAIGLLYTHKLGPQAGLPIAMLVVAGGVWVGGLLSFALGRTVLRQTVLTWTAKNETLAPLLATVSHHAIVAVMIAKVTPGVPAPLTNYGFGVTPVRCVDFACGSLVSLLWPLCCVLVGSSLQSLDQVQDVKLPRWVPLVVSGVVAVALAGFLVMRAVRNKFNTARPASSGREEERAAGLIDGAVIDGHGPVSALAGQNETGSPRSCSSLDLESNRYDDKSVGWKSAAEPVRHTDFAVRCVSG